MDWIIEIFRNNQVIPIFLTLDLGFWFGRLKYKSFSLGPVTATLIVGVVIGQIGLSVSETVKSLSFMLFLFAIGYNVGPQFFRSLKGDGLMQICFALVECSLCIATCVGIAKLMGYDKGIAVGIFAVSQIVSAVIGVGGDTIRSLGYTDAETKRLLDLIPACYAVCYVFGTIGSAWIIANLGPWLLGDLKKVKEETARIEEKMDSGDFVPDPGLIVANRPISFRAYRVEADYFNRPRSVAEIKEHVKHLNLRHFVERLRIKGEMFDPEPGLKVRKGDIIVLSGRRESIIDDAGWIGPEVTDHDLLNFATENLPVTVSKSGAAEVTIGELKQEPFMRGVMIHKILRNEMALLVRNRVYALRKGILSILLDFRRLLPWPFPTAIPIELRVKPTWSSSGLELQ